MLAILQFIFSSFWTFAGTVVILALFGEIVTKVAYQCRMAAREFGAEAINPRERSTGEDA
jgi:hypothetical protein